jgi:putative tryptophan/tyrosine transport system substrate-binding protein
MKILGGAAAGWPIATNAQERERRIGVILPFAADDPESSARIAGLVQCRSDLGWTVGRNVRIDYRWGASNDDRDRVCRSAAELLGLSA